MTGSLLKKFLVLILLAINATVLGQDCSFLAKDIQGNTYTTVNNEVIKVSANNAGTFRISNKLLGDIYTIDIRNPMRPLLFYKDVQKLVITDNTLSKQNQSVISFEELGMYQITVIGSSKIDNGIWLYDQELFQIIKIDQHIKRKIETGNLKQILRLENLEPLKLIETGGYLYLQCKNNGILVFDIYGTYYKTIPLKEIKTWNIENNLLLYTSQEQAFAYNIKTLEVIELQKLDNINPVWIDNKIVYFCNGNIVQQQALKIE
jgi:hypothetical protein